MNNKIYIIIAYRWGCKENHSYIAGVKTEEQAAIKCANETTEERGGKYSCCIEEWTPDQPARERVAMDCEE